MRWASTQSDREYLCSPFLLDPSSEKTPSITSDMASTSPRKKASTISKSSVPSTATAPAVPIRHVPFVTVSCSSYSQLFSTLCRPALFLSAAAAELTVHLQQRAHERLQDVRKRRAEGDARQLANEGAGQPPSGKEEEQKQQLLPTSARSQPAEQWALERRALDEDEQRLQADLMTLSAVSERNCVFDLRTSMGQALKLHETGASAMVKEQVTGAGEYTLLVAQRTGDECQPSAKLSFSPLALQAV